MKNTLFLLLAVMATSFTGHTAVKTTEEAAATFPPIWEKAGPRERLKAVRAAELDGDRRLAGRMMGVTIEGNTTVNDFCLNNDRAVAALSHVLKAATPTAIKYQSDGSCAVTMEIKVADIIRTTRRFMNSGGEKTEIKDEIETRTFSETGMGTMQPVGEKKTEESVIETSGSSSDPFFETKVVIRQVVQSAPIVQ